MIIGGKREKRSGSPDFPSTLTGKFAKNPETFFSDNISANAEEECNTLPGPSFPFVSNHSTDAPDQAMDIVVEATSVNIRGNRAPDIGCHEGSK